jgi:phospholipid/cholesterol/gamma-HCH transport system substrate-binding protein
VPRWAATPEWAAGCNLRGQGGNIRDTVLKLSQAISALGDHSGDLFTTA